MRRMAAAAPVILSLLCWVQVMRAAEEVAEQWVSPEEIARAATHWTRERLLNAKPMPMLRSDRPVRPRDAGAPPPTNGSLRFAPETLPEGSVLLNPTDGDLLAISGALVPDDSGSPPKGIPAPVRIEGAGYDYPPPQTTFYVLTSLYSVHPYCTVGKVAFYVGGDGAVCSGSSIGGRAVLTAGHCICSEGRWHTDWVFIPAYRNGTAPYGVWPAFYKTAFTSWLNDGQHCRDVAFAAVVDQGGKKLSKKVGALGIAWDPTTKYTDRLYHWNVFGYPASDPFDGYWLVETQASYAETDSDPECAPDENGIGGIQTGGSSGGPWILDFTPGGGGNYANSVNSYHYTSQPYEKYGPYFDKEVKKLRDAAVKK